jgi:hypothetical protein
MHTVSHIVHLASPLPRCGNHNSHILIPALLLRRTNRQTQDAHGSARTPHMMMTSWTLVSG